MCQEWRTSVKAVLIEKFCTCPVFELMRYGRKPLGAYLWAQLKHTLYVRKAHFLGKCARDAEVGLD